MAGAGGGTVSDVDDSDPAVEYKGGWHRKDSPDASAGGFHRRMGSPNGGNDPPPAARLVFRGWQITHFYGTSENRW